MARIIHTPVKTKGKTSAKQKTRAPVKAKPNAKKTKANTKRPASASRHLTLHLNVGDWLDVLDSEGTWNVAEIIAVTSPTEVMVQYDGWGDDYNEVVPINTGRVAPYHTYTWAVKCWAKYKEWPWWPAIVTFRSPGTMAGQEYLAGETRMFVDFLDNVKLTDRCRAWVERTKIKPFNATTTQQYRKATSTGFEASFARLLLSDARSEFAPLVKGGTLPVEFKSALTLSCQKMKAELGLEKWLKSMNSSQVRHGKTYAYQPASIKEDLGFDSEDVEEDPHGDLGDLDYRIDEKPLKKRAQSERAVPPKKLKTERSAPIRRLILTGTTLPGSPRDDEGKILDGPHAPSPNRDDEEDSSVDEHDLLEVMAASDPAHTSEEEEERGPSRVLQRLHVRRNKDTSPMGDVAVSKKRPRREETTSVAKPKTASRPRPQRPRKDDEHEDNEAPAVEAVDSDADDSSDSGREETLKNSKSSTHDQDREEPEEIVLSSDEEISQLDLADDLGVIDAVDEEDDAVDPAVDEEVDIVAITKDNGNGKDDAVDQNEDDDEEDEEDDTPADPLDDWSATRSSGVEELIEVGVAVATPLPSSDATEDPLAVETRIVVSAQGEDREEEAGPGQDAEGQGSAIDASTDISVMAADEIEAETAPRMTEELTQVAGSENTEDPMFTESAEAALKKPRGKSGGAKTTKTATKGLPDQRSEQAPSHIRQASSLPVSQSGLTNGRGGNRRSSMRASRVGHIQMPRGKTPVWVLPPPLHEPPFGDGSSVPLNSVQAPVVPTSPSFSSDQSFHSSTPFKIQSWIETRIISADLDT